MNVTKVIDCLDENASEIEYTGRGKVIKIHKYVLHPNKLHGANIFKIPQEKNRYIYITDDLKNYLENSDLKGFEFDLVWDSDSE
ncbi:imm11 family protein [Paenibacillus sp. Soil766]|uniref:imm11 family protein n=1 Tax=Paenibacillus sp. Soil766 TaxID=1736404 RepID=UPI0039E0BA83